MKSWFDSARIMGGNKEQYPGFARIEEEMRVSFGNRSEVEAFFEALQLLEGVPLSQILIDDGLLPQESLRFFYVDPNWVDCLIDGAMSIGRSCGRDAAYDRLLFPHVEERSRAQSRGRRSRLHGLTAPGEEEASSVRTGFLLRSRLVSGWPGLEVACYVGQQVLPVLRLNLLGHDVLLCIAEGKMDRVEFTEPGESACFGFYEKNDETSQLLVSLAPQEMGKSLNQFLPVPFRGRGTGVVDILALIEGVKTELKRQDKLGRYFSSLEFAVEMLHRRTRVSIDFPEAEREGGGEA